MKKYLFIFITLTLCTMIFTSCGNTKTITANNYHKLKLDYKSEVTLKLKG